MRSEHCSSLAARRGSLAALVGMKTPAHVEENAALAKLDPFVG